MVPRVHVSSSFRVDSVHLNFSSVLLIIGLVPSLAPSPFPHSPFSLLFVCPELIRPVVSSGLATSYWFFLTHCTSAVHSAPVGSVLIVTCVYQNFEDIHHTISFRHCRFSHSSPVRDGFGFIFVADATTSGVQAVAQAPFVERVSFALGTRVLEFRSIIKAISPSEGAELVIARWCGEKRDSKLGPSSKGPMWTS